MLLSNVEQPRYFSGEVNSLYLWVLCPLSCQDCYHERRKQIQIVQKVKSHLLEKVHVSD